MTRKKNGKKNNKQQVVEKISVKSNSLQAPKKKKKNSTQRRGTAGIRSPYLKSLIDPFNCRGARVPDDVTTPSFPVSLDQRIQINCGSNTGTLGNYVFFGLNVGAIASPSDYITSVTDTAGVMGFSSANVLSGGAGIVNTAGQIRPVSCGLSITFAGSTNTDQGRLAVGYLPGGFATVGNTGLVSGIPATLTNWIANSPYATTLPAAKRFASVRWCPSDPISRSYTCAACQPIRLQMSPAGQKNTQQYGLLWVFADGLSANSTCEVRVSENIECIPLSSTTSYQATSPSFSNPTELAEVSNLIAADRTFNVDQSWMNEMAGTSTNVTGPPAAVTSAKNHAAVPGVTSNLFLGDVGAKLGKTAGDTIETILGGLLL